MADNTETQATESKPFDEDQASPTTESATDTAAAALSASNPNPPEEPIDDDAPHLEDHEDIRREFLSLLPPAVHPRLERLKSLNDQREELLQRYQVERAALEVKYADLMTPLYDERRKVVNGELDEKQAVADGEEANANEEEVKGIPQFWACAMGNVDVIAELITEGA
jgi:nucleosome assembly protein 1-like 1